MKNKFRYIVSFLFVMGAVSTMDARVFLTQDEALDLAFQPGTAVRIETLKLDQKRTSQIESLAKAKLDSNAVQYYVGTSTEGVNGYVFFDTHNVRTMPETLMTVLSPEGKIRFVEIMSFYEPDDYMPPQKWLKQFDGKSHPDDLWVKRKLRNVTGATLTAQSISKSVRKALAVYLTVIASGTKEER